MSILELRNQRLHHKVSTLGRSNLN